MKKVILMVLVAAPLFAQAKVADFNALIDENVAAQNELSAEVGAQVEVRRQAFRRGSQEPIVMVDQRQDSINVPTDKNFLRFKKEIVHHQVSPKQLNQRVASEVSASEMEF